MIKLQGNKRRLSYSWGLPNLSLLIFKQKGVFKLPTMATSADRAQLKN